MPCICEQKEIWLCYYELLYPRDPDAAVEAGLTAYQLQPNNVLVNMNLGYACLFPTGAR